MARGWGEPAGTACIGLVTGPVLMMKLSSDDATTAHLPGSDLSKTRFPPGNRMRNLSTARFFLGIFSVAVVGGPQSASAQQLLPPPGKPAAAPSRPATTPAPRVASCHNGASFDRFLADLKQQAVAAGVSQRTITETSPYLVYDQGIVNRDRGQRVFGQVFTAFAGRMAAPFRMQQGQARIKTYAAALARAEEEYRRPPAVYSTV